MLRMSLPAFSIKQGDFPGLLEALGVGSSEIFVGDGAEPAVIVLLEDQAAVEAVRPDFRALERLNIFLGIVTAPGDEQTIASRVFCPGVGIDEDPVTGAAHAALVPYWARKLGRDRFTALQASARTGILDCELAGDRVILGGRCFTVIEGHFQL
jgi:predicted PhzF superfamily epimerase YddE/YHI9